MQQEINQKRNDVSVAIDTLVKYGVQTKLVDTADVIYVRNRLIEILQFAEYEEADDIVSSQVQSAYLQNILDELLSYAVKMGLIEDTIVERDLFDTKLMGALMPMPSSVRAKFAELYEISPKAATDYYYELSQNSDYIRRYRVCKDRKWVTKTKYGDLDITINLSKPEKDPKAIAAAAKVKSAKYPKCLLCLENEGYMGNLNHPARQNHRVIPVTLQGEQFYWQYSPYVYFNEHCIVFNEKHIPMKIDRQAFLKLLDFVGCYPHYFVGSNADLPIVGGSILSHEHFQGGCYTFPIERAGVRSTVTFSGYEDVQAGIVEWPMSVIRIAHESREHLAELADQILQAWRGYTDEDACIYAETDGEAHNTITPIARRRGDLYEMDLVLRNNLTTAEYPLGLYHPHQELHHIKKENIGLIEVMGLAILPARLNAEMQLLEQYLVSGEDVSKEESLQKHADWVNELREKYGYFEEKSVARILEMEIGLVFEKVLEHAGVYGLDELGQQSFKKFVEYCN